LFGGGISPLGDQKEKGRCELYKGFLGKISPKAEFVCVFVFFFIINKFCDELLIWRSSIRIFSLIWRYSDYESEKVVRTLFHVVGSCGGGS
jgi:hypothetical protein